tara:strand:+ start:13588 stop:14079 length:492 start_codon:yes stop_codon:yes gene_type:complete
MITNYLSPASFTISIERLPNVEFFTQTLTIPDIASSPVEVANPLKALYATGDRLTYGDLDLSFVIDEDMQNYLEVLGWMEGLGTPDSTDQFKAVKSSQAGLVSDIRVLILNSHKNPNKEFVFTNAFPTSMSSVDLDITQTDITYPKVSVTFRYDDFKVNTISG